MSLPRKANQIIKRQQDKTEKTADTFEDKVPSLDISVYNQLLSILGKDLKLNPDGTIKKESLTEAIKKIKAIPSKIYTDEYKQNLDKYILEWDGITLDIDKYYNKYGKAKV